MKWQGSPLLETEGSEENCSAISLSERGREGGSGWGRREGREGGEKVKGSGGEGRGWKEELQMSFCSHAFCFV